MIFRAPVPFKEALDSQQVKTLLPTTANSMQLKALAPEIRQRAVFSSRVNSSRLLSRLDELITRAIEPSQIKDPSTGEIRATRPGEYMDRGAFRLQMRETLRSLGYQPTEDDRGTITDLTSERRLNVMFDMNVRMTHEYGGWMQGQDETVLDVWPAQELYREEDRKEPRNWIARWKDAGGKFFGERMIALKNDPIWVEISEFNLPYPPFDWNSGMGIRDVDRQTAIEAKLIDLNTRVAPQQRPFNQGVEASIGNAPEWLLKQVVKAFAGAVQRDGDTLRLAPAGGA